METDTSNITDTVQSAAQQAAELAVSFSFSIVGAVVLIIAGFIVAGALERWADRMLRRFHDLDETPRRFLAKFVRYLVLVIVGVAVLAEFGVQTASILAALGAAGLAIGLALQGTLQNVAAGLMLLVLKPFKIGEYVDAGGIAGTIEEVGLFATQLKTIDGLFVLAPNSQMWNSAVTNYTRNATRRNDLLIGIGYGDDIDLARQTLADLATRDARVLKDPEPATFVSELGDSAVGITLRYWTTTSDWWQTRLDLTEAGKKAFDEKGISIPFPQRDVHYLPAEVK